MQAPHILIITAVKEESVYLRDRIQTPHFFEVGGREGVSGHLGRVPVRVVTTGPGQVNAVQGLTATIEFHRPDIIIQTGCAGAFKASGVKIGDIAIATEEIDAHLGIEPPAGELPLDVLPFPVGVFENKDIRNRYPMDERLTRRVYTVLNQTFSGTEISIHSGSFLTVSTITATDRTASTYHRLFSSCMESMEGAGAALVAIHYRIPFIEIRSASNFTGKRERNAWDLPLAFERCGQAVMALLEGDTQLWFKA